MTRPVLIGAAGALVATAVALAGGEAGPLRFLAGRSGDILTNVLAGTIIALIAYLGRKAIEPLSKLRDLILEVRDLHGELDTAVEEARAQREELRTAWNLEGDETPAEVWQGHVRDFREHVDGFKGFIEQVRDAEARLDAQVGALQADIRALNERMDDRRQVIEHAQRVSRMAWPWRLLYQRLVPWPRANGDDQG